MEKIIVKTTQFGVCVQDSRKYPSLLLKQEGFKWNGYVWRMDFFDEEHTPKNQTEFEQIFMQFFKNHPNLQNSGLY